VILQVNPTRYAAICADPGPPAQQPDTKKVVTCVYFTSVLNKQPKQPNGEKPNGGGACDGDADCVTNSSRTVCWSVSDLNAICRGAARVLGRLWNVSGDSSELGSSVDATVSCDLGPANGRVHRGVVRLCAHPPRLARPATRARPGRHRALRHGDRAVGVQRTLVLANEGDLVDQRESERACQVTQCPRCARCLARDRVHYRPTRHRLQRLETK